MLIGIKIKTLNDQSFDFDLEHDTNIYAIKTKLKNTTGTPEERQRLIYKGHVLNDESTIEDYRIADGHAIHMVARPADYEELQRRNEEVTSTSDNAFSAASNPSLQTLLALSALSGTPLSNGPANSGTAISEGQSIEAIRQGLLTSHTLLSSVENGIDSDNADQSEYNQVDRKESTTDVTCSRRTFYMGQWLDVKDTVNQWLEATVMDINYDERKVFVHYNGWPPRWDEWIDFASDRIMAFRTRTANSTSSQASPMPCNVVASAPVTGPSDVRHIVPELLHLLNCVQPMLQEAALLCSQDLELSASKTDNTHLHSMRHEQGKVHEKEMEKACARGMPWHSTTSHKSGYGTTTSWQQYSKASDDIKEGEYVNSDSQCHAKLASLARDISPLLDRLGRAMADTAPHFLNLESSLEESLDISGRKVKDVGSSHSHTLEHDTERSNSSTAQSLYRPLITNPAMSRGRGIGSFGGGGGSHLDIHIHAIVAPPRGRTSESPSDVSSSIASSSPISSPRPTVSPVSTTSVSGTSNTHVSDTQIHAPATYSSPLCDSVSESPPARSLLKEEEDEQMRRRLKLSSNSTRSPHSGNYNKSLLMRDDIEELYDANFGDHFRRARRDELDCCKGKDLHPKHYTETGSSLNTRKMNMKKQDSIPEWRDKFYDHSFECSGGQHENVDVSSLKSAGPNDEQLIGEIESAEHTLSNQSSAYMEHDLP